MQQTTSPDEHTYTTTLGHSPFGVGKHYKNIGTKLRVLLAESANIDVPIAQVQRVDVQSPRFAAGRVAIDTLQDCTAVYLHTDLWVCPFFLLFFFHFFF